APIPQTVGVYDGWTSISRRGDPIMDRRAFIVSVASGLTIARSVAEGQPATKVYRVGVLLGASAEIAAPLVRALTEGLRNLGYLEGHNVVFECRYADGALGRLPN